VIAGLGMFIALLLTLTLLPALIRLLGAPKAPRRTRRRSWSGWTARSSATGGW